MHVYLQWYSLLEAHYCGEMQERSRRFAQFVALRSGDSLSDSLLLVVPGFCPTAPGSSCPGSAVALGGSYQVLLLALVMMVNSYSVPPLAVAIAIATVSATVVATNIVIAAFPVAAGVFSALNNNNNNDNNAPAS